MEKIRTFVERLLLSSFHRGLTLVDWIW